MTKSKQGVPEAEYDPHTEDVWKDVITDRYLVLMLGRFLAPYFGHIAVVFVMLLGVSGLTTLLPYLTQRAIDGPIASGDLSGLVPYGVVYFLTILALFILRFGHTYLLQTVGQNALAALRQTLFEHILRQDMGFFNKTP